MRIEFRRFAKLDEAGNRVPADTMVLIPETKLEEKQLDHFFGSDSRNFENSKILDAYLCADDNFSPYLRVTTARLSRSKIVDGVLITEEKLQ